MAQQPKVVKVGPGGRSNGPRPKVENPGKVFKRILAYVMSRYKAQVIVVLCCILLAVFAQLQGVMFSQTLIDSYILPLLKAGSTDFSGLAAAILRVAVIYCVGIAAVLTRCSPTCRRCPSNTLTPTPTATLCRSTRTTLTRCAR